MQMTSVGSFNSLLNLPSISWIDQVNKAIDSKSWNQLKIIMKDCLQDQFLFDHEIKSIVKSLIQANEEPKDGNHFMNDSFKELLGDGKTVNSQRLFYHFGKVWRSSWELETQCLLSLFNANQNEFFIKGLLENRGPHLGSWQPDLYVYESIRMTLNVSSSEVSSEWYMHLDEKTNEFNLNHRKDKAYIHIPTLCTLSEKKISTHKCMVTWDDFVKLKRSNLILFDVKEFISLPSKKRSVQNTGTGLSISKGLKHLAKKILKSERIPPFSISKRKKTFLLKPAVMQKICEFFEMQLKAKIFTEAFENVTFGTRVDDRYRDWKDKWLRKLLVSRTSLQLGEAKHKTPDNSCEDNYFFGYVWMSAKSIADFPLSLTKEELSMYEKQSNNATELVFNIQTGLVDKIFNNILQQIRKIQ